MAWLPFVVDLVAAVFVLFLFLYVYFTYHFDYWKKKGLSGPKPLPFFGNFVQSSLGKVALMNECEQYYRMFKSKGYGGLYQARKPLLMVCDPEMIKQILTKDFSSLVDHGMPVDDEPLSGHLFNQTGDNWRHLRYKLAPVFTSGKLKLMYPLIKDCVDELVSALQQELTMSNSIDLSDLLSRSATDVIGTCAFGVQCNSVKDSASEFHTMSRKIFVPNTLFLLKFFLTAIHVKLARLLPFSIVFPGMNEFFVNLMKDTIEYRKKNGIQRNDFVNLLMEIKAKDDKAISEGEDVPIELTDNLLAAQGFVFFIAGLDNISHTIGFCLHEMAINPDIQNRLLQDVNSAISKHDGEMTYYAVKDMKYLEQVINESLRRYTAGGGVLMREVTAPEYKIPGTDITIEKNVKVFIPTSGIHMDPDIYPDPERFDPDRFTEEAKSQRHPFAFLPFGEGPRFCIAQRFAMLEMKVCLAALVREFQFSPCAKTSIPMKLHTRTFAPTPLDGFWLKLDKRV